MRRAGWEQRIGMGALALACALAFLACGPAAASDLEWQFPLLRDAAGSGMTLEISREGTRQTATPFLTLYDPTVRRVEYRIGRMLPPLPGEITVRSVKGFLKELRASRKKRPVPPVAVSVPERRVGRADTAPPEN
jgi:hypothetical protein